ncbi:LOW QUALITY PROTEIN: protocadherin Fat 1-like [Lethenteron reissneri]|uniref:LOW QUALITY PROTEIN: protocadherin Fat 1-like n=1 Tax=Lethenteron reissneri TaxID=7753 RepID=UPI002AB61D06|nr:LOW QUALITY PROTEIN: protocadherin Fat 1-like [Lethenteron reissneri]
MDTTTHVDTRALAVRRPAGVAAMAWGPAMHVLLLLSWLVALGGAWRAEAPGSAVPLRLQFTRPVYNATIYENSAVKTYVESREMMGVPLGDASWDVKYKVVSGDDDHFFKVEEYTVGDFCFLRIRTKGGNAAMLNREVSDRHLLTVKATVRSENLEAWTKVLVQVLDTNDLRPLFSPTSYSATVGENAPLRTTVARVTATDADVGTNGEYYFSLGERTDVFAVHPTTGVVMLTGRLDPEVRVYNLEVLAVDRGTKLYGSGGASSAARLTVRVERRNEHSPAVSAAATLAPSSAAAAGGATYAVLTVTDEDAGQAGEIASVAVVAGDPLGEFRVVKAPGAHEYWIQADGEVDWDGRPHGRNLTVQAKDRGQPPRFSAGKVVTLRGPRGHGLDARFEKSEYKVHLSEFAPPGSQVALVRAAPHSPKLRYHLKASSDSARFEIDAHTGLVTCAAPLDVLQAEVFELEVTTNAGLASARVVVKVKDENNHLPTFKHSSYKAVVNENVPVGSSVVRVLATDLDTGDNGYVTYSIANQEPLPFSIDPFTGVISTADELDYEVMSRVYSLRVRASDWGSPYRHEAETLVTVAVGNLNDNRPAFERVACVGTVPRDLEVGEHVATVSAIDADEMQLIRYDFVSGNEPDTFALDPSSGVVSLRRPLTDAAGHGSYSLRIRATDGENAAGPMFINLTVAGEGSVLTLRCQETGAAKALAEKLLRTGRYRSGRLDAEAFGDVHGVNWHAPEFGEGFPSPTSVPEDLAVGATVATVTATDADGGFDGKVVYVISGGNDHSCFSIEGDTGRVKVLLPLDREQSDAHTLNITAYDLGIVQKSSWRLLLVKVLDVNDNPPEFLQPAYSVTIPENAEQGKQVIQVEAVDRDVGDNGRVTYRLLTYNEQFEIDGESGVVRVVGPLDRETVSVHHLTVEASDRAELDPRLSSTATVSVFLEDVNDNPPEFVPPHSKVRVREDLPPGTVVAWLETRDADLGASGQARYSLLDDGDGAFEVDKLSGVVRLARELDFESRELYNLTARAKDKGRPASLSATCSLVVEVVDVNENLHAPEFPSFVARASVREDVAIGTEVLTVSARDGDAGRDGEVRYSVRDGSGLGVFSIHPETGVIRTAERLDAETRSRYWLSVFAVDRALVPLASTLHVFVEVEDVNDCAPLTEEPMYRPAVPENSPAGLAVLQVRASDADAGGAAPLSFRISSGNPQGFFSIDARTGLISTTARKLDREQQAEHVMEVTVSDQGPSPRSSSARVAVRVLDENDNRPAFSQRVYRTRLPERERSRRREPVYRVFASDADEGPNADLSYYIEGGNEGGRFFIDPTTGVISTAHPFQAGSHEILTVKAVDNGRPQQVARARVHMEWVMVPRASSEPLRFDEPVFSFTVLESDGVNHMVGIVSAHPQDVPLWFAILGGNVDSRFDVERGTGTLVVAKPLDAEQKSHYNLTVEVTDGTRTLVTQIYIKVIDVNDHRPEFSRPLYEASVREDVPPNTEVARVSASDGDEKDRLIYTLYGSAEPASARLFRLDPATGVLYTAEPLDHESQLRHTLTVMVRDQDVQTKRSLARVLITVLDANDHTPEFTLRTYQGRVFESALPGSAVLQVTARDRDTGDNARLSYAIESGNTGGAFSVDPALGIVSVARELDRARLARYRLVVRATDNGERPLGSTADVEIEVTVASNAPPRFTRPVYAGEVGEAAPPGTLVAVVSASGHSSVVYEIRDGNFGDAFEVNPNSGAVFTRRALSHAVRPSYLLVVRAADMAGAAANASVSVHVRDENDRRPAFARPSYGGLVAEDAPPGSAVLDETGAPLVVRAADGDAGRNALLAFRIVEPAARRYFAVDASTGAVRTARGLDREERHAFAFSVQVRDGGSPPLHAETPALVTVLVVDVNDSPPEFTSPVYDATLLLPAYRGVEVLTVSAVDADASSNTNLTYFIADGNAAQKFAVGPSSGVVTVQNVTALERFYDLTVRVTDGKFSSSATVKISTAESKPSGLAFTREVYNGLVTENTTEAQLVALVTVTGNRLNEPVFYRLLNPRGLFEVGRTSGALRSLAAAPLDREERERHELVVEARDERSPPRVARAVVRVRVLDVNDNAPAFVGLPYYAAVRADAERGETVRRVTAVDRDAGPNGEVRYALRDDFGRFDVDEVTGDVRLREAFSPDGSYEEEFALVVRAEDGGVPPLWTDVEVAVRVVNEAMPVFEKPFYRVSVPESVPPRTPLLSVQAGSPDGFRLVYCITDGDRLGQFSVDLGTGVLSTAEPLDYETRAAYRLAVRATDSLTGAHADATVDVLVEDVNDNAPAFALDSYEVVLSEAAPVGTLALTVSAADADSGTNRAVSYQIVDDPDRATEYFHVDPSSGMVLTSRRLDRELVAELRFAVRAVDGGVPALTSDVPVTVAVADFNDNAPAFTQGLYEATVGELVPRGHPVTRVLALDADASDGERLAYGILSGNELGCFAVDARSGVISVSAPGKLRADAVHVLNVTVSDGVHAAAVRVRVAVTGENLHGPVFERHAYEVELAENSPVGTAVAVASATDRDAGDYGKVSYSIVNDFAGSRFGVGADGLVVTTESLDRENLLERVIEINVMAVDGGGRVAFCVVKVILTDVNDNAPRFHAAEYKAAVPADAREGAFVAQVTASDADEGSNADVAYSIYGEDSGGAEEALRIDPESGAISSSDSLVGLEGTRLSFFVLAQDGGLPSLRSLVPVYVEVLPPDVAIPRFAESYYSFAVAEDAAPGTELEAVRVVGPERVTYSLVWAAGDGDRDGGGGDGAPFGVDATTGRLKLERQLDHEAARWLQFSVAASRSDGEHDAVAVVQVSVQVKDVNDNAPAFESATYEAFVMENLAAGTRVLRVRARDADSGPNGQVSYSLGEAAGPLDDVADTFALDADTGWLTALRPLDCEAQAEWRLEVVATDRGERVRLSSRALVSVRVADVNDNPPRFTAEIYRGSAREDDVPGEVVAILSTSDADSEPRNRHVSYYITDGDPLGHFGISVAQRQQPHQQQREAQLFVRRPLDRERQDTFLLNVTATDGAFSSSAVVEVRVQDVNDNRPRCQQAVYTVSVPEDVAAGRALLLVHASDADSGENARLRYSLHGAGAERFRIDPDTGELRSLAPLDREETAAYSLTARATDGGGLSCQASVLVQLEDVNDNAPAFTTPLYSVSVYESTAVGTLLTRVQATDPDRGLNRKVQYSLEEPGDPYFEMDADTGMLSLARPLDRELRPSHHVTVVARDGGAPRALSSSAAVVVSVLDVNDSPPTFEFSEYSGSVPEDAPTGTEVAAVLAVSRDAGTNADIAYAIVGGNEHGRFSIDPHSGIVVVAEELDYEVQREHFLTVQASDGGTPSLSAVTTVSINLTDVNDHAPQFGRRGYSAVLSEDAPPGTAVLTVMAEDRDGPDNNRVAYSVSGGDPGGHFALEPGSGRLSVVKPLDRETVSGFALTVRATDSGTPAKFSEVTVNVDVSDVNDNAPVFAQSNYSIVVQENRPADSSVLQLLVTDLDSSYNGPPFAFSLLPGDHAGAFYVDAQGTLRTAAPLSRQEKAHYALLVQAADSGRPALSSRAGVEVRVIPESVSVPSVVPLEVLIVAAEEAGGFAGGVLGKIHATDLDVWDALRYSPAEEQPPFAVGPLDGKLVARAPLAPGRYRLHVAVSDGRFSVPTEVSIRVEAVSDAALRHAALLRFRAVSPEEFVAGYAHNFQRALPPLLGARHADVRLLSLQPDPRGDLDVLFVVERPAGGGLLPQAQLLQQLNGSLGELGDAVGLRAAWPPALACDGCAAALCRESVALDSGGAVHTYSTARLSLVTPRHHRTAHCACTGAACVDPPHKARDGGAAPCDAAPCGEGERCEDAALPGGFRCTCLPGRSCQDESALTFRGSSYVRYALRDASADTLQLSLRLRTHHPHGVLVYTRGTDYAVLELVDRMLQFQFDCGSGPGVVSVRVPVSDGHWHSVSLEVTGNQARLVVDAEHEARGTAAGTLRSLNLDASLYLGARVRAPMAKVGVSGSVPAAEAGFHGCLDAVVLNGQRLSPEGEGAQARVEEVRAVSRGCLVSPENACAAIPCLNGGACVPTPHNGGFHCRCAGRFAGARCEVHTEPCSSDPCQHGGACIAAAAGGFLCRCRSLYTGSRCELPADLCASDPCENGGACRSVGTTFNCSCATGYSGDWCQLTLPSVYPTVSVGWQEMLGLGSLALLALLIIAFVVVARKCLCGRRRSPTGERKEEPPPVPVRPISYTPSVPSDSRNNLDRGSYEGGADYPSEFSTFNPDSAGRARRGVAVCSVAPNLPPPPPSNSASDCDSIQKSMWEFECEGKLVDGELGLGKEKLGSSCYPAYPCPTLPEGPSLASLHSDTCDDNGYHWDTSDWLPDKLQDIEEEICHYPAELPGYSGQDALEHDYYAGGYDIDSDYPPPPEEDDYPEHTGSLPPPPPPSYRLPGGPAAGGGSWPYRPPPGGAAPAFDPAYPGSWPTRPYCGYGGGGRAAVAPPPRTDSGARPAARAPARRPARGDAGGAPCRPGPERFRPCPPARTSFSDVSACSEPRDDAPDPEDYESLAEVRLGDVYIPDMASGGGGGDGKQHTVV